MFDGTAGQLPACPLPGGAQTVWVCDEAIIISFSSGYVGQECFYDSASHMLVGADVFSDTPTYCGGKNFGEVAGRVPGSSCRSGMPALRRDCNSADGGAD